MTTTPTRPPTDDAGTRRRWLLPLALAAVVLVAVGLWLTQPWLLFVDTVADESLPIATTADADAASGGAEGAADPGGDDQGTTATGDEDVEDRMGQDPGTPDGATQSDPAAGETAVDEPVGEESAADQTTGDQSATDETATTEQAGPVVLAQGSFISRDHGTSGSTAIVQLEDGSRVLTIEGLDTDNGPDLFVYLDDTPADGPEGDWDDGVSLGRLRANQGDLVYEIPDELDLTDLTSVGIWCDRFSSLFGAADLVPAA